jgi:hypothetical protein
MSGEAKVGTDVADEVTTPRPPEMTPEVIRDTAEVNPQVAARAHMCVQRMLELGTQKKL